MTYIILTHTLPPSEYQEFGIYTLHFFSISFRYIRFQADSVLFRGKESNTLQQVHSSMELTPCLFQLFACYTCRGYKQQQLDFKQFQLYPSSVYREYSYLAQGTYLNYQGTINVRLLSREK